jgi:enoyl-CoA hydratase/carnithine racemase
VEDTAAAVAKSPVKTDAVGGVRTITLDRPERRNAWSIELEVAYFDALDDAVADSATRAIVLTATGSHFCPGLDVDRLEAKARGVPPPERSRPVTYPFWIDKPIVAAINGTVAGIGLVQVALCDVRFIAAGTRLSTAFARRGLVAEHLLSWLLPRMVGHTHASDLLLSGRVFTAEEALRMGFVNQVVPAEDLQRHAHDYARDLAENCSPLSMAQIKSQLRADWCRNVTESLADSEALKADPRRLVELAEGVASFRERRSPRYAPLDPRP